MQAVAIKKCLSRVLVTGCLLLLLAATAASQNINTPNKTGPMGLQVNTFTGNLFLTRADLKIPARGMDLNIQFSYNSFNYSQNNGFGNGWSLNYYMRYLNDTGGVKVVVRGDGREDVYKPAGGNAYKGPAGRFGTFTQYQPGKFRLRELNGLLFFFDNANHRKVTRIEDPNGNFINFTYTDTLLTGIANTAGQSLSLVYSGGLLSSVVDANGAPTRTFTYSYDAAGNLVKVTNPLGHQNSYSYLVNGPLKTVTDKNSNVVNVVYYHDFTVSELVGCNKRVSFSYDPSSLTSYVVDHLAGGSNQVTKYQYKRFGEQAWLVGQSGNCCGFNVSFEYDDAGNVVKLTDARGNVYRSTYDDRGNLLSVTDPMNHVMKFTYGTDFNQILTGADPSGNVRALTYDSKGNLTQIMEPGGRVTTLSYSPAGDLIQMKDANGNLENYTYDSRGYMASVSTPLGYALNFSYDQRGNLVTMTDPKSFSYSFEYDVLSRLKKSMDPQGNPLQLAYDAESNLLSILNAKGQSQKFSYDASNRLVSVVNALGHRKIFSYDEMNNITRVQNVMGQTIGYTYDSRNRLTSVTDALGNSVQYAYDPNGNMTTASYPNGRIVRFAYDVLDRPVKLEDNDGLIASVTYDANGNITNFQNGTGAASSFAYDGLDRLTKQTDALGNRQLYEYDNNDNLLSTTNRNGQKASFVYDALNRPTSYKDENNLTTTFAYDVSSNLASLTDPKNNTTTYSYDNSNRLTKTTYPNGKFVQYSYDELMNILAKKMADGRTVQFQYDSLNRLVSKTLPDAGTSTYGYDARGRLVSASGQGSSVTMGYDAIGRRTFETLNSKTTRYTYDNTSMVRNTIYPDSTVITKTYDKRYRLTGLAKGATPLASYQYNAANQLTQTLLANQVSENYQYDFANRLNTVASGNGAIQQYNLRYDNERNITGVARASDSAFSEDFAYDAGNRLTNYKRGPASGPVLQQTFSYDAVGNRTTANLGAGAINYTYNNLNQLTASTGSQSVNFTYDDNGNLTFDGTYYKTYNADNRLLMDSASPTNKITYQYDALGRKTSKTVNGVPVVYSYAGLTPIEERNGNTDALLKRLMATNFLNPVSMERNGASYFYHTDHLGSVQAISNASGNVVEKYSYDAYGNMQIRDAAGNPLSNSTVGNNIGFTGQRFDEAGDLTFPFRHYSPKTGRFLQRDPLGYADGLNLYEYVGSNPASHVDPLGLISDEALAARADAASEGSGEAAGEFFEGGYHGAKTVKDLMSLLSGLDRNNLLKMMEKQPDWVKELANNANEKGVKEWLSNYSRLNQFLNNAWVQRFGIALKVIALPEKFYKIWKEWDCGKWKTFVNTAEAGLSTTSLLYSLGKYFKWSRFKSSPTWMVYYTVLDITSKSTTNKSLLTNLGDLPYNVYEIEKSLWYMAGGEDRFGSLDDVMTGNWGGSNEPMPNFYGDIPEQYITSTHFR